MLIHSASQLLTLSAGPQRGPGLGDLGLITDGAVLIHGDRISALGSTREMISAYPQETLLDASSCVVMPGFVDPHTHVIWSGDRAAEFEMRLEGKTYLEILAAGGGILSTVRATRTATIDQLVSETRPRLRTMLEYGTTTVEAKTGYGLDLDTELRMLKALIALDEEGPVELAITFLGAHAIAPEYKNDPQAYTNLICNTILPELRQWWPENRRLPFVDVFCETGAFNLHQSRQILVEAKRLGFPLKIHADEFDNLGGAALAAELGAVSADHLVATSAQDIQVLGQSGTVAVALPATPFGLAEGKYTPAAEILSAGGMLALATDLNPGTAWCESMQFAIALGCRYMGLTPAQAIAASTINAAAAINQADRIGSLEPGKLADLIVLKIPNYQQLGYRFGTNLVKLVIKRGQIVVEN